MQNLLYVAEAKSVSPRKQETARVVPSFVNTQTLDYLKGSLGTFSLLNKILEGNLTAERVSSVLDEVAQKTVRHEAGDLEEHRVLRLNLAGAST